MSRSYESEKVWIAVGGNVYHSDPDCSKGARISTTAAAAGAKGFDRCSFCWESGNEV